MTMKSSEMSRQRTYAAIDLKSFYASVECNERGLNPLTTNLVAGLKRRSVWQYLRLSKPLGFRAARGCLRSQRK